KGPAGPLLPPTQWEITAQLWLQRLEATKQHFWLLMDEQSLAPAPAPRPGPSSTNQP
ncbi:hypothetical protein NDU88_005458, partial [Pleurodeles waltl]